jgi:quinoprotein glucose dehydrogenase
MKNYLLLLLIYTFSLNAQTSSDWPTFGGPVGGGQFSMLDQINTLNVSDLEVAWVHESGDNAWLEATPIHANHTLYYCSPMNRIIAINPITGDEQWRFDPYDSGSALISDEPRVARCRSVAYWESSNVDTESSVCPKRVFKGDIHGNLYAVNADTGEVCSDFGQDNGHPGYVTHWDYEGNGEGPRHTTSGPLVIGDIVISAVGVEDSPVNASDGFVRGFNVRTGELVWEFNPIPADRVNDVGAANVWSTISGDAERKLVFLPTTSPSSDFYGGTRTFPIPLGTATVALSSETGEVAWSYQIVRHDVYDYDLPGHPLNVTIRHNGELKDVAIQQTKQGYIFVFDTDTGESIFPIIDRKIPTSDVPGEVTALTQPFPTLPVPFTMTELTRDDMFGLTPFDRAWCQNRFDELRYEGMYTPPSIEGTLHFPGFAGGGNWGGAAFDPVNNLLIVKSLNIATVHNLIPTDDDGQDIPEGTPGQESTPGENIGENPDGDAMPGTNYRTNNRPFMSPLGVPCTPPPWGSLTAINMDSGQIAWQEPFGRIRRYGITFPESLGWGTSIIGGPITTSGGLIFMAASMDKLIRAIDVTSGIELWSHELPYAGMAVPMTYMENGEQYVVIAAGGNRRTFTEEGDAIVAFKLP